jgi:hypothetical protein
VTAAVSTPAVRERGILFSSPMVRALRAGRKTVTRRICRVQPEPRKAHHAEGGCQISDWTAAPCDDGTWDLISTHAASTVPGFGRCPYGAPGDQLLVQEGHALTIDEHSARSGRVDVRYLADGSTRTIEVSHAVSDSLSGKVTVQKGRGRPGRFMPRWASRTSLVVTDIRVERLQSITDYDIRSEGIDEYAVAALLGKEVIAGTPLRDLWRMGWDAINGHKSPWSQNCFVWRVAFDVLPQTGSS